MPYNTRHKSLSLPSLGIHVPVTYAERAAAASARSIAAAAASAQKGPASFSRRADNTTPSSHPNKRFKRSHNSEHGLALLPRPSKPAMVGLQSPSTDSKRRAVAYDHTPPLSPTSDTFTQPDAGHRHTTTRRIDIEGINDHIVEAVITQLEATANRPHLVKELAMVLTQKLADLQQYETPQLYDPAEPQANALPRRSANPSAIISSRISAYMKRSYWSALAPCPIARESDSAHPRRSYLYLTTTPPRALNDDVGDRLSRRVFISPSISGSSSAGSFSGEDDDVDGSYRRELSPSPDVDLSPDAIDDISDDAGIPTTPIGSMSHMPAMSRSQRSASPPLEKDEKEFTQTADGLQKRKLTTELVAGGGSEHVDFGEVSRDDAVFDGKHSPLLGAGFPISFAGSPAVRASYSYSSGKRDVDMDQWPNIGQALEWDPNPEDIELDELDCLLEAC